MSSDSNSPHPWKRLQSGSEIRGDEALLTDDFARRLGYAFAHWLAQRLSIPPEQSAVNVKENGAKRHGTSKRKGFRAESLLEIYALSLYFSTIRFAHL